MYLDSKPQYDLQELASRIEFDKEDYIPLLSAYIEQTVLDLDEIDRKRIEGNEKVISERIHNIKGAALNLGLNEIHVLLEQMSALNHAEKYDPMEEILNKCRNEVDTLKKLL